MATVTVFYWIFGFRGKRTKTGTVVVDEDAERGHPERMRQTWAQRRVNIFMIVLSCV